MDIRKYVEKSKLSRKAFGAPLNVTGRTVFLWQQHGRVPRKYHAMIFRLYGEIKTPTIQDSDND